MIDVIVLILYPRYPVIVSLVTGLCVLLSLALVTISLTSAPVWELGGVPALHRVRLVTAQLLVVSIAQALAFNFYFYSRHEDMRSVGDEKYVLNIRRRESQNSAASRPNGAWSQLQ